MFSSGWILTIWSGKQLKLASVEGLIIFIVVYVLSVLAFIEVPVSNECQIHLV